MSSFVGLYVDAGEFPSSLIETNWTQARTFHEALTKLELMQFEVLSLNHTFASTYGYTELTCCHVIYWLIDRKNNGLFIPPKVVVHSTPANNITNIEIMVKKYLT